MEWALAHPYLATLILLAFAQASATVSCNVVLSFYNAIILARQSVTSQSPKEPS